MKTHTVRVAATIAFLVLAAAPTNSAAEAAPIKVFLLAGQSNMDGRADSGHLPPELAAPQDDVLFYYTALNRLDRRSVPLNELVDLQPGAGTDFGPEVAFGRHLADACPNDRLALVKYARGGTSLHEDWALGGGTDRRAFTITVNNGLNALTAAGHDYEIEGMLWAQGIRDMLDGRSGEQYTADLNQFIADVRTSYGADLPFFLARYSDLQESLSEERGAELRAAQEAVAAGDPNAFLISTDGFGLLPDDVHFNADGQVALGRAFAQSFLDNVVESTDGPTAGPCHHDVPEPTAAMLIATAIAAVGVLQSRRRR